MNSTSSLLVSTFFRKCPVVDVITEVPHDDDKAVDSPQGTAPEPFTFKFSQVKPQQLSGGTAKVVDSTTFKIATNIAAAEVTVEPGAMRYVTLEHHKREIF